MQQRVRALVIPTDAVFSATQPLDLLWLEPTEHEPMYRVIQDLVGGDFQVIFTLKDASMLLNVESKLLGLDENIVATALARGGMSISMANYIAGQVVVVGLPDREGNETDVPEKFLRTVEDAGCVIRDSTGTRPS
jgi:acyl-coenzyme A thioesterase PaaI-like protein